MKKALAVLAGLVALVALWGMVGFYGLAPFPPLGFELLRATPSVQAEESERYSTQGYDELLGDIVHQGGVDYDALEDDSRLPTYVRQLEQFGPESTPDAFEGGQSRFAYYINAYNALVLYAVYRHWPIESVQDVDGWFEPREGFGFFYGLHFVLDGQRINLYELEHRILREQFKDARVHAAINCASASCPPLHHRAFQARDLGETLDDVTQQWVASEAAVRIDEVSKTIRLNPIFDWFRGDFVRDAEREDYGSELLDWIEHFLVDEKKDRIREARSRGFDVEFYEYDWTINDINR
jgi:hypothetical protein